MPTTRIWVEAGVEQVPDSLGRSEENLREK